MLVLIDLILILNSDVISSYPCPFHRSQKENTEVNDRSAAPDNPVVCEAEDSFMCSVALDTPTSFVTVFTVSISDAIAPPVLLRIPARPGKKGILFLANSLLYIIVTQFAFL